MLKTLTFLLCTTLVSMSDICRRKVPLTPAARCGPQQTMFNEGECLCCYYDTKNIPTIGVGFNLQRGDAAQVMSKYNLTLSNVLKDCTNKTTNYCLTDADAKDIFNTISYPEFGPCADRYAPGLPPVKRAAIIDVAFAGCGTLSKFVKMREALNKQDWKTAAEELRNSAWCKQVGQNRCNSNYNCIAGCTGQTCGAFTNTCSKNYNCDCFKASNGTGFCADAHAPCGTYPDCTSCSPLTSVCVVNSCCVSPICLPLSLGQKCIDPPTRAISKSNDYHIKNTYIINLLYFILLIYDCHM